MFKQDKYYGEVWLETDTSKKCFATIEVNNGEVKLVTNLHDKLKVYQVEVIYGVFNGLGFVTFVNNKIMQGSSGITEARIYLPKYIFSSSHHNISPKDLKIKEFNIDNKAIVKWAGKMHYYDTIREELIIEPDIKIEVPILHESIRLSFIRSIAHSTNQEFVKVENIGYVKFHSEKEVAFLEAIELYNVFQKLLLIFHGTSIQFNTFNFKCLGCNEWASAYFESDFNKEKYSSFVNIQYDFINDEFEKILREWYDNDDIQFCANIIVENLMSKVSHSRRFTNSIAAFEAFYKRFGKGKHKKLNKRCDEYRSIISEITSIEGEDFDSFIAKIIRSRDFYVHGNQGQKDIFTQFELLYISLMFDYVVIHGLLVFIKMSDVILDRIIAKAKSAYKDMQWVNRALGKDMFKKK